MNTLVQNSRLSNVNKAKLTDAIDCEIRFSLPFSSKDEYFYINESEHSICLMKVILHNNKELYEQYEANIEHISKDYISIFSFKFGQKLTYKIPLSSIINL
jgi:hypothetical protein